MRFLAIMRSIRACALALWLGGGLAMLAAILLVIKYRADDPLLACDIVNALVLNAGKAKVAIGLLALAAQAVLFFGRAQAAPPHPTLSPGGIGWGERRHFAPMLLVMAALAAAIGCEFSLSLTLMMSHFGIAAGGAPQKHLHVSSIGLALFVLELVLVAAALAMGAAGRRGTQARGKDASSEERGARSKE